MTLVGKIFVIAITVLAAVFLGLSTVVFATANNWKALADKRQEQITKLNATVSKATEEATQRGRDLEAARKDHESEAGRLNGQIADLNREMAEFQTQATAYKNQLEKASENAKNALAEAQARVEETDKLRDTLANLQSLTDRYKEAQLALQDQVVQLERDLGVAKNNNKDLRERAAVLSSVRGELDLLRADLNRVSASTGNNALKDRTTRLLSYINRGIADPTQVLVREGAPRTLRGEVTRVDARGRLVELSVGSDDGLVPGHRLMVYRTSPREEYVGDITIKAVEADTASADVTRSNLGRKPQEGDLVQPAK